VRKSYVKNIVFIGYLFGLVGCVVANPVQNFYSNLYSDVGKKVDNPNIRFNRYSEYITTKKELSSGNIEYEFQWSASCITYFEVDSERSVIVGWRKHLDAHFTSGCRNGG